MPNDQTKKLVHGSMAIALFIMIIIIAFYVPIANVIAVLFAPLPIAWFAAKYDRMSALLVALVGSITSILFGGFLIALIAWVFAMIGFMIGDGVRLKQGKIQLLLTTGLTLLFTFALFYVALVKFFEIDFIKQSMQLAKTSYKESIALSEQLTGRQVISPEQVEMTFQMMEAALPSTVIISAFLSAVILLTVNLPLLKRFGFSVPKFAPFQQMRLPRSVLWYYFIVLAITLFVRPEVGSFLYIATLNASVILWMLLALQGVALLFFIIDAYKAPRFLKGLTAVMAIPLYSFIVLVGILDLGFGVRQFIQHKNQKK